MSLVVKTSNISQNCWHSTHELQVLQRCLASWWLMEETGHRPCRSIFTTFILLCVWMWWSHTCFPSIVQVFTSWCWSLPLHIYYFTAAMQHPTMWDVDVTRLRQTTTFFRTLWILCFDLQTKLFMHWPHTKELRIPRWKSPICHNMRHWRLVVEP